MWMFLAFACLTAPVILAQHKLETNDHEWDITLAVPGQPGNDYPTLSSIPRTTFSCSGKAPGYYGDLETNCQVFRVCTSGSTFGFQSFLCPNGTLFNQEVLVCDWWMNVNCKKSKEIINNNNEKFGNLKLGPQLIKDVKKMLTYPMRNPYDKAEMRNKLVVMQEYKPPKGSYFSNIISSHEPKTISDKDYVSTRQLQKKYVNIVKTADNGFSASTISPQYRSNTFYSIHSSLKKDAEDLPEKQYNSFRHMKNLLPGNIVSKTNDDEGHIVQKSPSKFYNTFNQQYTQISQNRGKTRYNQYQVNNILPFQSSPLVQSSNSVNKYLDQQQTQYSAEPFLTKNFNNILVKHRQAEDYYPQFPKNVNNKAGNEAKENLVSTNTPSTVIRKTLTINRIIEDSKPNGRPKSRIIFKTWIVKPSRSAKFTVEPTPYYYQMPLDTLDENLITEPTAYVYNNPNKLKEKQKTSDILPEPYFYEKPASSFADNETIVDNNQSEVEILPPTMTSYSLLDQLSSRSPPTTPTRKYLSPTTFRPSIEVYLPPTESIAVNSNNYLPPMKIKELIQNVRLVTASSTVSPNIVKINGEDIDGNDNIFSNFKNDNLLKRNQTFTDILTKEKLDLTVGSIVKDTSNFFEKASSKDFDLISNSILESTVHPTSLNLSDADNISSKTLEIFNKEKTEFIPSPDLEPPFSGKTLNSDNKFTHLPFFIAPSRKTNTIERTVSIKISIPEKIAMYLFRNDSDFDKLEILNTGSSNYLVSSNTGPNSLPIGKLIVNKDHNISDSQDLVFSFLADSLNAAKEYNTIAQQNLNTEDISSITNKVSLLTSQHTANQYNSQRNTLQADTTTAPKTDTSDLRPSYSPQRTIPRLEIAEQLQAPRYSTSNFNENIQSNIMNNLLYSGQLYQVPVPDVSRYHYNEYNPVELQQNLGTSDWQQKLNRKNNKLKSTNDVFEIVESKTLSVPRPVESIPITEPATYQSNQHNAQKILSNLLSSDNGFTAQVEDKVVGTVRHPSEDNKLLKYQRDQSYYVFTKLNSLEEPNDTLGENHITKEHKSKLKQRDNSDSIVTFQFIPSLSYQLEDEREKQNILNAFQINELGVPANLSEQKYHTDNVKQKNILTSNVDYTVTYPTVSENQSNKGLYNGPSSYAAPQASVGNLKFPQNFQSNKLNSRLEQFDENNGYLNNSPEHQINFKK